MFALHVLSLKVGVIIVPTIYSILSPVSKYLTFIEYEIGMRISKHLMILLCKTDNCKHNKYIVASKDNCS